MQTINIQETTSLHSIGTSDAFELNSYDAMLAASHSAHDIPAGDHEIFAMQESECCFSDDQVSSSWLQSPSDCDSKPDDKSSISKICKCAISGCYNCAGKFGLFLRDC